MNVPCLSCKRTYLSEEDYLAHVKRHFETDTDEPEDRMTPEELRKTFDKGGD